MEYLEYKSDQMLQKVMLYEKVNNFCYNCSSLHRRILNEQA